MNLGWRLLCLDEHHPVKSRTRTMIPTMYKEYRVAFEVQPLGRYRYGWSSLLHLNAGGQTSKAKYGDRCPGIWFRPNSLKLHICSPIEGYTSYYVDTTELPINNWTKIEIFQQLSRYTVKVGGKIIHTIYNSKPEEFKDITVWESNKWNAAAIAKIRNLEIYTYDGVPERFGREWEDLAEVRAAITQQTHVIMENRIAVQQAKGSYS